MSEIQSSNQTQQSSLGTNAARQLATTTKTAAQMAAITPRWLLGLLPWVQVGAGTYRVNRVKVVTKEDEKINISFQEDGSAVVAPKDLRSISIFRDVDQDIIKSITERFVSEKYESGQTILTEGQNSDKLYIIAYGKVEVSMVGPHGENLRLAVLASGDVFGEVGLIKDSPCIASVQSLTSCIFLTLAESDLETILKQSPTLRVNFEEIVKERLQHVGALVAKHGEQTLAIESGHKGEAELPEMFVDYDGQPREYPLSVVQTIARIHTRVSDLYNDPIDQLREQLRLTIEGIKEKQEWEIINNPDFGLANSVTSSMRIQPRYGPPTPDDMDALLALVWNKPAFFLAHPKAIAAFGRECTWRGVPPPTVQIYGCPFLTWRGVPIIPCNKLEVDSRSQVGPGVGTTSILLMRVGEENQGVVGLHQTDIPGEQIPGLSVRQMGIDNKAIASYLLTMYFSCAVLTPDALAMLENVVVGYYHDYTHRIPKQK